MATSPLVESTRRGAFVLLTEHWARDKIGRFASHDHPGSETGWGPSAGGAGTQATAAEVAGARRAAMEKYRNAKPPTAADKAEFDRKKASGMSADDIERDMRGSSIQRRARKNKMIGEFGNAQEAPKLPDGQEPSGQFDSKGKSRTKQDVADEHSTGVAVDPYCGRKIAYQDIQADRIYPGSAGGKYTYDNVIPCCGSCNKARSDTDFKVFFNRTGQR